MLYTAFDEIPRADYAAAEYILADCCEKFPSCSALSKRLAELYGASLSSRTSLSWSGTRCTGFFASVLDDRYALDGEEKLEREMCDILCECLLNPKAENGAFDKQVTALQKAQLIDDIDSIINERSAYAAQRANMTAFKGEPFEQPVTGSHEQAEKVTAQSAYSAYRKMLKTARIDILCAGASDFSDAEKVFSERFSKIERCDIYEFEKKPSALKSAPETVRDTLPMQQAILRMYFKAPNIDDRFANSLMCLILGGMTTSRFFVNIREKQSLCYYCNCMGNRFLRSMTAAAGVEPCNIERAKDAVLAELRGICENGVTEEELKSAKLELYNTLSSMGDNPAAMVSWYHSQRLDDEMLSPEEYFARIEEVDAKRVRAAAREYTLDTVYTLCPPDNDTENSPENGGQDEL